MHNQSIEPPRLSWGPHTSETDSYEWKQWLAVKYGKAIPINEYGAMLERCYRRKCKLATRETRERVLSRLRSVGQLLD